MPFGRFTPLRYSTPPVEVTAPQKLTCDANRRQLIVVPAIIAAIFGGLLCDDLSGHYGGHHPLAIAVLSSLMVLVSLLGVCVGLRFATIYLTSSSLEYRNGFRTRTFEKRLIASASYRAPSEATTSLWWALKRSYQPRLCLTFEDGSSKYLDQFFIPPTNLRGSAAWMARERGRWHEEVIRRWLADS